VYIWGRGEYGRLGIGDRSGSSKLRPHRVRGLETVKVVQASAGGTHTMALTSTGEQQCQHSEKDPVVGSIA
jgi:alpha-tubulin suppressor-like RCC1 family protein